MKHEPRQTIHMEKSLLIAVSLVGQSLRDVQDGTSSVCQVVGVSDMAPTCGSVALLEGGFRKGKCTLPTFLSERKLFPISRPDARHFSFSPYGAFQAAIPVLELKGSESE